MKRIYIYAIILFSVTLLTLFILYNRYSNYDKEENRYKIISKNIDILNENMEFERQYALSLSLFISKNSNIKKALLYNNQKLALNEIRKFLRDIKKATNISNIDIQVHTKNLKAFARSWDNSDYLGADLSFRKGLVKVKNSKEPFVSIELGKRLNIKAISPIFNNQKQFIGSIETIMDFTNIKNRLKKFDLNTLTLLDKKYIKIAVDLKKHPQIGKYYIAELNYSKELLNILKREPNILLSNKAYHIFNNQVIVLIPMLSVGIEDVGVIVLSMREDFKKNLVNDGSKIIQQNREYKFNNRSREVIIK